MFWKNIWTWYTANHVTCSSKFRGGIHTGEHDPRASCCELVLRVGEGNQSLDYNFQVQIILTI